MYGGVQDTTHKSSPVANNVKEIMMKAAGLIFPDLAYIEAYAIL